MEQTDTQIGKADIFWNANRWYWVDVKEKTCKVDRGFEKVHDAVVDAIRNGFEINDFRKTRGSVKVGTQYT